MKPFMYTLGFLLVIPIAEGAPPAQAPDILIADFESEPTSIGKQPATHSAPVRPVARSRAR